MALFTTKAVENRHSCSGSNCINICLSRPRFQGSAMDISFLRITVMLRLAPPCVNTMLFIDHKNDPVFVREPHVAGVPSSSQDASCLLAFSPMGKGGFRFFAIVKNSCGSIFYVMPTQHVYHMFSDIYLNAAIRWTIQDRCLELCFYAPCNRKNIYSITNQDRTSQEAYHYSRISVFESVRQNNLDLG
ncbi:hypothetical protein BDZ97DRAFT_984081 [Flammula alnicola]|nr:hypothetical protein BDZ97DRAFT_984081 [Flammula alnicola]